jgi:hypothetical protein
LVRYGGEGIANFLAVSLYMGMNKQPNIKSYWAKSEKLFYCPIIAKLLTQRRFLALRKCLHLNNPNEFVTDKTSPLYDKMHQCRWLLNVIRDACRALWNVGKMCTVDEMMVRYKRKYCPARQYMPKKTIKWGLKLWCLACAASKFIYNFDVYCGKSSRTVDVPEPSGQGNEGNLAEAVVLKMVDGTENKGHVVFMDNYFIGVGLFKKLLDRGIYATGTVRNNCIGLPLQLSDTKEFNKNIQGTMDWRMHDSRKHSCVVWKDKKSVLLLSTHAKPIVLEGEETPTVPCRNGEYQPDIKTSPIHLEYTNNMRGVDVADHVQSNYSCQVRTHKW